MHYHPVITSWMNATRVVAAVLLSVVLLGAMSPLALAADKADKSDKAKDAEKAEAAAPTPPLGDGWVPLFDGKTMKGWKPTNFGGEGRTYVEDGRIFIEFGNSASGITLTDTKKLPRINYELSLEAMRFDGNDFFCGLTFPVGKDPCSLICGGWGGGVTGLSNVDNYDASENDTSQWINYKNKKWYKILLRVTDKNISVWLDKEHIIDVDLEGRKVGIRPEVELSKPLGVATWNTTACLRNIYVRKLPKASEKKKPAEEDKAK